MTSRRWSSSFRRSWLSDLDHVQQSSLSWWSKGKRVKLLFTSRRVPHLYSAVDRQTFMIGLFPKAQTMGRIARQETIVHECCHLAAKGFHGREWKSAMKRSARAAEKAGDHRLAKAILNDIELYNRRPVTDREVQQQLDFILAYGERSDFPWVLTVLADWAGWPKREFLKRYPWVRGSW